ISQDGGRSVGFYISYAFRLHFAPFLRHQNRFGLAIDRGSRIPYFIIPVIIDAAAFYDRPNMIPIFKGILQRFQYDYPSPFTLYRAAGVFIKGPAMSILAEDHAFYPAISFFLPVGDGNSTSNGNITICQ